VNWLAVPVDPPRPEKAQRNILRKIFFDKRDILKNRSDRGDSRFEREIDLS
jgi:hypothetical protein